MGKVDEFIDMTETLLLEHLKSRPDAVHFQTVTEVIAENYHYTAVPFVNGDVHNEAGTNEGSCKLFAFGQLHGLSESEMLACFGDFYRQDVVKHPEGEDHQNIRQFMKTGWAGIRYDQCPLTRKSV